MPRHDPVPRRPVPPRPDPHGPARGYEDAAYAWARYKRLMRWMATIAFGTAAASLFYLWASGQPMRLHMVIAVFAGVALTVLVGTGLMGLVFLSSRSGHDEDAAHGGQDEH